MINDAFFPHIVKKWANTRSDLPLSTHNFFSLDKNHSCMLEIYICIPQCVCVWSAFQGFGNCSILWLIFFVHLKLRRCSTVLIPPYPHIHPHPSPATRHHIRNLRCIMECSSRLFCGKQGRRCNLHNRTFKRKVKMQSQFFNMPKGILNPPKNHFSQSRMLNS